MASLAVEETSVEEALLVLEELRVEIFGNKYLYLYILQFVSWDAIAISGFQQTCRANREWKKKELKEFEWEWRWKKIEALIGKEKTEQMKQGSNFKGLLDLTKKGLDDDACKMLAPALAEMKGLESLWLGENKIADEGCRHLANVLPKMIALKIFSLWRNNVGWRINEGAKYLGAEGAKYLAESLKVDTSLESIVLVITNIGAEGAKFLAEALKVNTSLKRINIGCSNISAEGAKYLAGALEVNTSLEKLYLGDNNISAEGAKYLADSLKKNTSLKEIKLNENNIGAEGAKYLAGALKVNTSLEKVSLCMFGKYNIGDEGKELLRKAWKEAGKPEDGLTL